MNDSNTVITDEDVQTMIGNTFKHKDNCHSIKTHTGGRLYSCSCCLDERKTLERLARENAMLHERTKPNTVVLIGNTGHYVNDAVAQHIDQLRQKINNMTTTEQEGSNEN